MDTPERKYGFICSDCFTVYGEPEQAGERWPDASEVCPACGNDSPYALRSVIEELTQIAFLRPRFPNLFEELEKISSEMDEQVRLLGQVDSMWSDAILGNLFDMETINQRVKDAAHKDVEGENIS